MARAIRAKRPGLPVLLATGYSDAMRDVHGEFPMLRKPYQLGELSRAFAMLAAPKTDRARADVTRLSRGRGTTTSRRTDR